jgi:hypothetical protein
MPWTNYKFDDVVCNTSDKTYPKHWSPFRRQKPAVVSITCYLYTKVELMDMGLVKDDMITSMRVELDVSNVELMVNNQRFILAHTSLETLSTGGTDTIAGHFNVIDSVNVTGSQEGENINILPGSHWLNVAFTDGFVWNGNDSIAVIWLDLEAYYNPVNPPAYNIVGRIEYDSRMSQNYVSSFSDIRVSDYVNDNTRFNIFDLDHYRPTICFASQPLPPIPVANPVV